MKALNLEIVRMASGMTPRQWASLMALPLAAAERAERPDVMLQGRVPAVGAVTVNPRFVGDTRVYPRYPGRVGAPAEMVSAPATSPVKYSEETYNAGDVSWFGLGATSIPALSTGTKVEVKPPRPFTPQQLYCPSTVQGLLVTSVSIQGTNIFCGEDGVPIELLSEVSNVPMIDWPTVQPSSGIVFTIANPTANPLVFSGALYGTQVRI